MIAKGNNNNWASNWALSAQTTAVSVSVSVSVAVCIREIHPHLWLFLASEHDVKAPPTFSDVSVSVSVFLFIFSRCISLQLNWHAQVLPPTPLPPPPPLPASLTAGGRLLIGCQIVIGTRRCCRRPRLPPQRSEYKAAALPPGHVFSAWQPSTATTKRTTLDSHQKWPTFLGVLWIFESLNPNICEQS